ncbi:hypothetical protein L596_011759 [Steinernema carpocapsae]|uniref:Protein ARV n=1 Tax=Steinernema carpocapsae TaxID=34508 RepID=A0A4U5NV15_STECR|nr:hypothetical protein L596_011759 [Steinernema carpocapsae]
MPMEPKESESDTAADAFVCINCDSPSSSIYQEYSKDVIRITECKKCGEIVDKYVEYDIVLVIMDLTLQYISAYRHLLINTKFKLLNDPVFGQTFASP